MLIEPNVCWAAVAIENLGAGSTQQLVELHKSPLWAWRCTLAPQSPPVFFFLSILRPSPCQSVTIDRFHEIPFFSLYLHRHFLKRRSWNYELTNLLSQVAHTYIYIFIHVPLVLVKLHNFMPQGIRQSVKWGLVRKTSPWWSDILKRRNSNKTSDLCTCPCASLCITAYMLFHLTQFRKPQSDVILRD